MLLKLGYIISLIVCSLPLLTGASPIHPPSRDPQLESEVLYRDNTIAVNAILHGWSSSPSRGALPRMQSRDDTASQDLSDLSDYNDQIREIANYFHRLALAPVSEQTDAFHLDIVHQVVAFFESLVDYNTTLSFIAIGDWGFTQDFVYAEVEIQLEETQGIVGDMLDNVDSVVKASPRTWSDELRDAILQIKGILIAMLSTVERLDELIFALSLPGLQEDVVEATKIACVIGIEAEEDCSGM